MAYHDLTETTRMSPPVDTSLPYDASSLAGKTILITGGALGLGANFARYWASHGANLMIGDINAEAGQQLVAELRTQYPKAAHHFFDCDVTDWDSQVAFFKAAASASPHGGIDIVVANAGINDPKANRHFENPKALDSDPDSPCKPNTKTIDTRSLELALGVIDVCCFLALTPVSGISLHKPTTRLRSTPSPAYSVP
ncbi:hypothetical protein NM208_g16636 [Fusarium decemcellulare]|uniref:Uncharacterized protein n=1 Tax=Fusarium decemcellulare TaxID=57161 RepID=A0ACC1RD32_9HYPO|nr:hypothetical protein NM208_g16636 [Fusarium decemcellulare]